MGERGVESGGGGFLCGEREERGEEGGEWGIGLLAGAWGGGMFMRREGGVYCSCRRGGEE